MTTFNSKLDQLSSHDGCYCVTTEGDPLPNQVEGGILSSLSKHIFTPVEVITEEDKVSQAMLSFISNHSPSVPDKDQKEKLEVLAERLTILDHSLIEKDSSLVGYLRVRIHIYQILKNIGKLKEIHSSLSERVKSTDSEDLAEIQKHVFNSSSTHLSSKERKSFFTTTVATFKQIHADAEKLFQDFITSDHSPESIDAISQELTLLKSQLDEMKTSLIIPKYKKALGPIFISQFFSPLELSLRKWEGTIRSLKQEKERHTPPTSVDSINTLIQTGKRLQSAIVNHPEDWTSSEGETYSKNQLRLLALFTLQKEVEEECKKHPITPSTTDDLLHKIRSWQLQCSQIKSNGSPAPLITTRTFNPLPKPNFLLLTPSSSDALISERKELKNLRKRFNKIIKKVDTAYIPDFRIELNTFKAKFPDLPPSDSLDIPTIQEEINTLRSKLKTPKEELKFQKQLMHQALQKQKTPATSALQGVANRADNCFLISMVHLLASGYQDLFPSLATGDRETASSLELIQDRVRHMIDRVSTPEADRQLCKLSKKTFQNFRNVLGSHEMLSFLPPANGHNTICTGHQDITEWVTPLLEAVQGEYSPGDRFRFQLNVHDEVGVDSDGVLQKYPPSHLDKPPQNIQDLSHIVENKFPIRQEAPETILQIPLTFDSIEKYITTLFEDGTGITAECINTQARSVEHLFNWAIDDSYEAPIKEMIEKVLLEEVKEITGDLSVVDFVTQFDTDESYQARVVEQFNEKYRTDPSFKIRVDKVKEQMKLVKVTSKRTKYSMESTPDLLTISLKRFEYDFVTQRSVKVNKECEMSRSFILCGDTYDLVFISHHMGGSSGGHYTSYRWKDNRWHFIDDSRVTILTEENLSYEEHHALIEREECYKKGYVATYRKR
jgi:hypothetical protein